jgi:hypothetical protein
MMSAECKIIGHSFCHSGLLIRNLHNNLVDPRIIARHTRVEDDNEMLSLLIFYY